MRSAMHSKDRTTTQPGVLPDRSAKSSGRLPGGLWRPLRIRHAVVSFHRDERGQDLVEYALIAGFIGLAAVTSAHGVAVSVTSAINVVSSELTSAL